MRLLLLILLIINLSIPAHAGVLSRPLSEIDRHERDQWVDSVMSTLTLRQKVGQLFIPVVDPRNIASAKTIINKYVTTDYIGGLLFSGGNSGAYAQLINYAQSVAKTPLMIAVDGEWGVAMRVKDAIRFPYNMTLGAINDPQLLYEYGQATAAQCRRLGIHVNFAPVLDVNSNPANPVIGYRSYGENPERVAMLGAAYARGLEDGGIISSAKHFPGHGDTNIDSHKALPTVDHDICTLDDIDLFPFRKYMENGCSGIMVGHLKVPALDPTGIPASMSRSIVTDLLRNQMKFGGLIFTDGLAMKGAEIAGQNRCVSTIKAGSDILVQPLALQSDIQAVIKAVESGEISIKDIDEHCKRMLRAKWMLGLFSKPQPASVTSLPGQLNSPSNDAIRRKLTAASITCLKNDKELLPIHDLDTARIAIVNIGAPLHNVFSSTCAKYTDIKIFSVSESFTPAQLAAISRYSIVIAAIYGDTDGMKHALTQLSQINNMVEVFFTGPYKMAKFAPLHGNAVIWAGEATDVAQEYAAQAVFGGIRVNGTLPVGVKGIAPEGTGIGILKTRLGYASPAIHSMKEDMTIRIDSLIRDGLTLGAFPGCQVLVAKGGDIVLSRSYGYVDSRKSRRVNDSTLYDIASVSKIAGTLPGIMCAIDQGLMNINDCLSEYFMLPDNSDKKNITIRQLLMHESGLPASLNMLPIIMDKSSYTGYLVRPRSRGANTIRIARGAYGNNAAKLRHDILSTSPTRMHTDAVAHGIYAGSDTRDTITQQILDRPLSAARNYRYSDLNFALLMGAEEIATGISHNNWLRSNILDPLGASRILYNPLSQYSPQEIAPTEYDRFARKQLIHGYVHDELAAFSGGIQGNAGLFANANDLAKLGQMWLNYGQYGSRQLITEKTVRQFITESSSKSHRGLGFDKPKISDEDIYREYLVNMYGHTGFTGTCMWIEPKNEVIIVFLSNRINPSRDNNRLNSTLLRTKLRDIVLESL